MAAFDRPVPPRKLSETNLERFPTRCLPRRGTLVSADREPRERLANDSPNSASFVCTRDTCSPLVLSLLSLCTITDLALGRGRNIIEDDRAWSDEQFRRQDKNWIFFSSGKTQIVRAQVF